MRAAATVLVLAAFGCDRASSTAANDGGAGALDDLAGGSCAVEVANPADEGAAHTTLCGPVTYAS
jgi:hypothetical protein